MTQLFEGVGIALQSLRASKVRAALTILGVAIGVMVVVVIGSMVSGINRGVEDIFNQLGPRTFFVFRYFSPGINVSDGSDEMSPWRRMPPLTLGEAERIRQLESVSYVVVDEDSRGNVEAGSRELPEVAIRGRGTQWTLISGGDIAPGRSFTNLEAAASGQSWNRTVAADAQDVVDDILMYDVLLVYRQGLATDIELDATGLQWFSSLRNFLSIGGIIVFTDGPGSNVGTWLIFESADLFDCAATTDVTGSTADVVEPGDAVAQGLSTSYL